MPGSRQLSNASARTDTAIAVVLFAATAAYVFNLAWFLGGDEGYYLYESARLLDGAVFYRDLFDLITPGGFWLLAGLFRLFGTTMATARALHAATQGAIVVLIWTGCRILGVRRGVAAAAALMQPALFESAWQCTSPHWLATLLALAVLVIFLWSPGAGLLPGIFAGLVIAVQQQKGVLVAAGGIATVLAGWLAAGRPGGAWAVARQGGRYILGVLAVTVPLLLVLLWSAGVEPVWTALVVFPLVNYRRVNSVPWGFGGLYPSYTFPRLLAWLPAVTLLTAARMTFPSRDPRRQRRAAILVIMAAASVGSIAYYPDYIHLAFISSVFAVLLGDTVEAGLRALPRTRLLNAIATALPAVAMLALLGQVGRTMLRSHRDFPVHLTTPFGTVDVHGTLEADVYRRVAELAAGAPTREVFGYPWGGALHLLTGTINPTPIQIYYPNYTTPEQVAATLATLEERRVPYVVTPSLDAKDPILDYVGRHYEQVVEDGRPLPIYRRRD